MVEPFSGSRYRENEAECAVGSTPCVICGKACNNSTQRWLYVCGCRFVKPSKVDECENDPEFLGGFPIGGGCYNKHRKFLKNYI